MPQTETNANDIKRVLKVNVSNKIIDLRESYCFNTKKSIRSSIAMETFPVIIKTIINCQHIEYFFYINYDELIDEKHINHLKKYLKITIEGDGALFEIKKQHSDITIEFDSTQTSFNNTENTRNKSYLIKT